MSLVIDVSLSVGDASPVNGTAVAGSVRLWPAVTPFDERQMTLR